MDKIKLLFIVAIIFVVVAIFNIAYTINKIRTTGMVTSTGEANVTVESWTMINFTANIVNWSSGMVTPGQTAAYLDSWSDSVVNGNWTGDRRSLSLENLGNTNVSVELSAGKSAVTFIGGTNPAYKWLINDSESGCTEVSYSIDTFIDANASLTACEPLEYIDSRDLIKIYFNLTIPYDSHTGALTDTITATATVF